MKLDENLAAIHAYLCADGYVIKNPATQKQKYYHIGFRNTNLILLRDFQEKFEKIFGKKPYLIEGQRCRIGSRETYEKLTREFGSFYSWIWKMPELEDNLLRTWLRAYFDCEGWVTCKTHQNRQIGVDCVNKEGINQIKEALNKLNIKSMIKKRNTRNIFCLKIYGKDNLIGFQKEINFLHPNKKEKLSSAIKDFVEYDWKFPESEIDLKYFVKEILQSKAKIKKDNGIIRIISKLENNLTRLQKELNRLFGTESKVNKRINGIGTVYFELNVNKQNQVKALIDNNLINNKEKEKWIILNSRK